MRVEVNNENNGSKSSVSKYIFRISIVTVDKISAHLLLIISDTLFLSFSDILLINNNSDKKVWMQVPIHSLWRITILLLKPLKQWIHQYVSQNCQRFLCIAFQSSTYWPSHYIDQLQQRTNHPPLCIEKRNDGSQYFFLKRGFIYCLIPPNKKTDF